MKIIKGCKKIYNTYGKMPQVGKLAEEAGELNEAALIYKEVASPAALDHLVEEAGDVLVVMTQLIQAGVIDRVQLKQSMEAKIDRQLIRISEGIQR